MTCFLLCLGVLHLCLLCLAPPSLAGSAIRFTATPPRLLTGLSPALTLGCFLNQTSGSASIIGRRDVTSTVDTVAEVTSIVIMKDGSDVASVSHSRPAHIMDGSTNVKVTGSVAGSAGTGGFLEVTIVSPTETQSGEFTCEVNAVSESGHIVTFSSSQEVVMATPTTADLVNFVRQLDADKNDLAQKYNDLSAKYNDLNIQHHQLKVEVQTKVFFSAGATQNLVTSGGDAVAVFDKVLADVGGGYNSSTGQFVCKVAGFYEFEVNFLSNYQQRHWAYLQHNQQNVVSAFGREGTGNQGTSSNSAIIQLAPGDVVQVLLTDKSNVEGYQTGIYSTFSGKLVDLF